MLTVLPRVFKSVLHRFHQFSSVSSVSCVSSALSTAAAVYTLAQPYIVPLLYILVQPNILLHDFNLG